MRIEIRPLVLILFLFSLPVLLRAQDDIPDSRHNIKPVTPKTGGAGKKKPDGRTSHTGKKPATGIAAGHHRGRSSATTGIAPDHYKQSAHHNVAPKPSMGAETIAFKPADGHRTNPVDGAEEIHIPEGWFWMGDKDESDNPRRKVWLDGYWIYKYPVTVAQFRKFTQEAHYDFDWEKRKPSWDWQDEHPMVNITWEDASAYSKWAHNDTTSGRVYLPTEAQWEKAARGTDGRRYPWQDYWDGSRCANSVKDNDLHSTVAVKEYANGQSPYGLYHMAGNVSQWCADWYKADYYKTAPTRNPKGPDSPPNKWRVLHGGSWYCINPGEFCAAIRYANAPEGRDGDRGFRCASGQ